MLSRSLQLLSSPGLVEAPTARSLATLSRALVVFHRRLGWEPQSKTDMLLLGRLLEHIVTCSRLRLGGQSLPPLDQAPLSAVAPPSAARPKPKGDHHEWNEVRLATVAVAMGQLGLRHGRALEALGERMLAASTPAHVASPSLHVGGWPAIPTAHSSGSSAAAAPAPAVATATLPLGAQAVANLAWSFATLNYRPRESAVLRQLRSQLKVGAAQGAAAAKGDDSGGGGSQDSSGRQRRRGTRHSGDAAGWAVRSAVVTAWSLAVLGELDSAALRATLRLVLAHSSQRGCTATAATPRLGWSGRLGRRDACMLHQVLLSAQLGHLVGRESATPAVLETLGGMEGVDYLSRHCHTVFRQASSGGGRQQQQHHLPSSTRTTLHDLARLLDEMWPPDDGWSIQTEQLLPDCGYSVDLLLTAPVPPGTTGTSPGSASSTSSGGRHRVVIELDGKVHWCRRGPWSPEQAVPSPLGRTAIKHRQVRALGWDLIAVPYWEWDAANSSPAAARCYVEQLVSQVQQRAASQYAIQRCVR
eukprot:COSAG01_NODE_34_length_34978_cov_45.798475_37_plen_529_part_00